MAHVFPFAPSTEHHQCFFCFEIEVGSVLADDSGPAVFDCTGSLSEKLGAIIIIVIELGYEAIVRSLDRIIQTSSEPVFLR